MRSLRFRPLAVSDLDDIWANTVERWSIAQAQGYLSGLNDTLRLLRDHPDIARLHEFTPPLRIFPYRAHLVAFQADDSAVEVIRILHMRSDWQVLLSDQG